MYRYLFEEVCFDSSFEAAKPLDQETQRKIRAAIAEVLGVKYEDTRLVYFQKAGGSGEVEYEVQVKIDQNFDFRVTLFISTYDKTIVSLRTYISRLDPVYLRNIMNRTESLVHNIFSEFVKTSFYHDVFDDYKKKYEGVSRKLYEALEVIFGV